MSTNKLYDYDAVDIDGEGRCIAIVASRFNNEIVDRMLEGCEATLLSQGVAEDDIDIFRVPGAFELPLMAQKLADDEAGYDAIITLGCVVRGDTPHFDYVCTEAARGVQTVALEADLPVIFGVLTTNTMEQAIARSTGSENKGVDAALSALEMLDVIDSISNE